MQIKKDAKMIIIIDFADVINFVNRQVTIPTGNISRLQPN